jgi:polyisoprenoid-binding protein YceI
MNVKNNIVIVCLFAATTLFTYCGENAPKGDDATIQEKQQTAKAQGTQYVIDTTDSRVGFVGHGVGKNHAGKFKIASGSVAVANNQITGGNFVIDIKSMDLQDKGGMFDAKLRPHLMSGDFFDAEKFATATFAITSVQPYTKSNEDTSIVAGANYTVSGNLTLKGETKNVSFPAKIDLDENTLQAKANFDIDRRQWQMNYGNDKSLGDKFISEKVNVDLDIQAKRQIQ